MIDTLPTPSILVDAATVRRNINRLAAYAASKNLRIRPHTKTHKSQMIARLQMEAGCIGLTVAKPGEAKVMTEVSDDVLMAYPSVDPARCAELADLAKNKTIRVGIDSTYAADQLSAAALAAGTTIGILVDLDVGHHRTGVQSPRQALDLAQYVNRAGGLHLDGVMYFPGHVAMPVAQQQPALDSITRIVGDVLAAWREKGLEAKIVSGGSTPTAYQSHQIGHLTEIRPGTYVYQDMNGVRGGFCSLEDCAARVIATVVSNAVPGQIVLDCGSKTLTSDRCGPAPDSGHGYIVEYPNAKVAKLSEEHAQVDITQCDKAPKVGQRVTVIPNHICPCINLQDNFWWKEENEKPRQVRIDARGRVY